MHLFILIIYCHFAQSFVNVFLLPLNYRVNKFRIEKQTKCYHEKQNKQYSGSVNNLQKLESLALKYTPKTANQKYYKNILDNRKKKMIIVNGPAGTGKTLFACLQAIIYLEKNIVDKIVLTRPTISIDKEDFGFLPGTLEQKMDPWLKPFFDILLNYYSQKEIDYLLHRQQIEICPLAYMRGRTFHNTFIIGDEMQNSSPHQMKTLATRIGHNSKLVILGDIEQSDLFDSRPDCKSNGLNDLMQRLKDNPSKLIATVTLKTEDIERSSLTKEVLKLYNNFEYSPPISSEKNNKQVYGKEKQIRNATDTKNLTNIANDCAIIPLNQISKHYPL